MNFFHVFLAIIATWSFCLTVEAGDLKRGQRYRPEASGPTSCRRSVEEVTRQTAATVAFYDRQTAASYNEGVAGARIGLQYTEFQALLPVAKRPRILDAGCGPGRDALYFQSQGIDVVAYDGSQSMVDFASVRLGKRVLKLDFNSIQFENEFDGVWAMASFLHAPLEQLPQIIEKHLRALRPGGILYMSFLAPQDGRGESFSEQGPYYSRGRRWLKLGRKELTPILNRMPNIAVLRLSDPVEDSVPGRHPVLWTEVLVRKLPYFFIDY